MDEPAANLTREWLTKALHDLQTARIVANAPGGPLDTAIAAYDFVLALVPAESRPGPLSTE